MAKVHGRPDPNKPQPKVNSCIDRRRLLNNDSQDHLILKVEEKGSKKVEPKIEPVKEEPKKAKKKPGPKPKKKLPEDE